MLIYIKNCYRIFCIILSHSIFWPFLDFQPSARSLGCTLSLVIKLSPSLLCFDLSWLGRLLASHLFHMLGLVYYMLHVDFLLNIAVEHSNIGISEYFSC